MSSSIKHFILVFDHAQDELLDLQEFGTRVDEATARYAELEDQFRDRASVDIVLVGSDSIDTVQVTHRTYFQGFSNASLDKGELERLLGSLD